MIGVFVTFRYQGDFDGEKIRGIAESTPALRKNARIAIQGVHFES